jgi:hypothetical protein
VVVFGTSTKYCTRSRVSWATHHVLRTHASLHGHKTERIGIVIHINDGLSTGAESLVQADIAQISCVMEISADNSGKFLGPHMRREDSRLWIE